MDRLKVSQIETSGGTQMRAKIDQAVVAAYREIIADLPPVDVFHDGTTYWLADGFHRYWAHHEERVGTIDCRIHKGGKRDAILFAVAANAEHGLQRSDADKRNAVLALLNDEEWREWADREIARRCSVGAPFVSKIRKSICNSVTDAPAPDAKNAVSAPSAAPRKFKRAGKTHSQKPEKSAVRPTAPPSRPQPIEPPPDSPFAPGDREPWRGYNERLNECIAMLDKPIEMMQAIADDASGNFGLFAYWYTATEYVKLFKNIRTTWENHRVAGWASETFKRKHGGRVFVYEFEAKQKGALAG
jgi:uncharacterized ParB-like nuclease family protein